MKKIFPDQIVVFGDTFWSIDASIGDTFSTQYGNGYRRYLLFQLFLALVDTDTFVVGCSS